MKKGDFPAPRFGTPRHSTRETLGPRATQIGRGLGREHMPWQRHVLDVAMEVDPGTGLFHYRTVILVITRQQGKTTILVDRGAHAALVKPLARVIYTAQNRLKALQRLEANFYVPILHNAPALLAPRRDRSRPGWVGKSGDEHILFVNDSRILIDAVKDDSGHGDTTDLAEIDEAFVHRDATIEQGVRPTMVTNENAQLWIASAAGRKGQADYLWEKVQLGRAVVEAAEPNSRICYFEWSDEDGDRADPSTWAKTMPALGHTITLETVKADFEAMEPDEFDRGYLGRWPGAKAPDPIIPIAAWRDCAVAPDVADPIDFDVHAPVYVVDTGPDREWTAVSVTGASTDPLARACVRLAGYEPGVNWAPSFLDELRHRFGGDTVCLAGDGAAASLQGDLESRGWTVDALPTREIAAACGTLYDDALDGFLRHTDDREVNAALAAATRRSVGDGWRWWRGRSLADISALYAVTLGYWGYLKSVDDDYDVVTSII